MEGKHFCTYSLDCFKAYFSQSITGRLGCLFLMRSKEVKRSTVLMPSVMYRVKGCYFGLT